MPGRAEPQRQRRRAARSPAARWLSAATRSPAARRSAARPSRSGLVVPAGAADARSAPGRRAPRAAAISRLLERGAQAIARSTIVVRWWNGSGRGTAQAHWPPRAACPRRRLRPVAAPRAPRSLHPCPGHDAAMNDTSDGASSTSRPPSGSSIRARITEKTPPTTSSAVSAGEGSLLPRSPTPHGIRLAQQPAQHTPHTPPTLERGRCRPGRLDDQQPAPPGLVIEKPQQRHHTRANPPQPALLAPSRLRTASPPPREPRKALVERGLQAILDAFKDLVEGALRAPPHGRPPSCPDGGHCLIAAHQSAAGGSANAPPEPRLNPRCVWFRHCA